MTQTTAAKIAAAKAAIPAISLEEAAKLHGSPNVLFVDVRDGEEVAASGKIAGATNVSRGILEFRADETLPSHNKAFAKDKTIILYCASGGRSALSGVALKELGYKDVRNLGAFKDWAEKGLPIERG